MLSIERGWLARQGGKRYGLLVPSGGSMVGDKTSTYADLQVGDILPRFRQQCVGISFAPDTMAGRYMVFCLLGSAGDLQAHAALNALGRHRALFDDERMSCFILSADATDAAQGRLMDAVPGIRIMWDFDKRVSGLLGSLPRESTQAEAAEFRRFWLVVDPTLHIMATFRLGASDELFEFLGRLPEPARFAGFDIPAPILVLPCLLGSDMCSHLIGLYEQQGGGESGVMRDNVGVIDRRFKSRKDLMLKDQPLIQHLQRLVVRRVVPEIERLFFLKITRMERYMVGCYAAEDGGHFRPHRDNTTDVTAHRRFAVSVNLNDDFDGGELSFPEYGTPPIKAPRGWAVVFPANILHAVSKVSRGRRYAFLPFVYDEAGAAIREAYLGAGTATAAVPAVVE